jgi:hypothetical protein
MPYAGPRQMVDQRRHALGCEHVHDLDARLERGIAVSPDDTQWRFVLSPKSTIS